MRVFLLAVGSQGDIRPLVSLANRLHREGHEAMLAAPPLFKPLAIAGRIPFAPLDVDMMSVGDAMASSHGVRHFAQLARTLGGLTETVLASAWAAASDSGADVVVHHPVLPMGQHIAERLGVPAVIGLPQPALVPTGEFSSPIWSNTARLPRPVHRASYPVATMQLGLWCRRGIDRWRAEAGLPRRPGRHDPLRSPGSTGGTESATPVLHAFSRHVLPRPADWPTNAQVSGYWFLDTPPEWTPPRKLAAFLDAGDPPVYIGFGSMPIENPGALSALVQETVERVGTRAVIASGYQGLRGLASSDRVLAIRHAPHDWLFPRMSAVVHHGGAGTTGAAVAAGRPQVICPVGTDQPFWAKRMRELGVCAEAPPLHAMTGPALERALRAVLDDRALQLRAAALGRLVATEDGPGRAVSLLEQIVSGTQRMEASHP
jgi:sterol 3beta-glucosyltransferase